MRLHVALLLSVMALSGCTASATATSSAPPIEVLFIGNSYTYFHDMPEVVESIAKENGVRVDAEMYALGGATLADHGGNAEVQAMISSGDFDVVVLQEQSQAPAVPAVFTTQSSPAARDLADLAKAAGAEVLLFQTWGHAEGNEVTGDASYGEMQQQIIASYDQLGEQIGARVVPVGAAWREAMLFAPHVELHDTDLSHPSPAGSYLAALVFADALVEGQLREAPDELVDTDVATALLEVAALVDEY